MTTSLIEVASADENARRAVAAGAVPPLVELLSPSNWEVAEAACMSVINICQGSGEWYCALINAVAT